MLTSSTMAPRLGFFAHLYMLLMLIVIAGILSAAMVMQYAFGELPCPLCLLQRVGLFGVAFAAIMSLREDDSAAPPASASCSRSSC